MKIIYLIIICASFLSAQDNIEELIQHVLHGSRDIAGISFPMIEQEYPNNPSVMYLKGLLETEGEKSMVIFSKLYNTHPTSDYGDDAVMKVAEYYYAAGLYVQSANWLKKMFIYYSRSEHIDRAIKLFLNSLIVSGHKDTAIFYSRVFKRQFPQLDVDGKINDLLRDIEKSNQAEKEAKDQSRIIDASEDSHIDTSVNTPLEQENVQNSYGVYSLQTGAFSNKENADVQKIDLTVAGFNARITELYRNDQVLYAVRIGHYPSKDGARKIGSKIKTTLDLDTIVILNNY